jgi:hypothetical protein
MKRWICWLLGHRTIERPSSYRTVARVPVLTGEKIVDCRRCGAAFRLYGDMLGNYRVEPAEE